jgi:hypothetical protein
LIETELNDIKERLSLGVVTLVAARAGCELSEIKVDRESIDVTMRPIKGEPVCIDAQLKGSSTLKREEGHLIFDLPINNYNKLRQRVVGNARILIVLDLVGDEGEWVTADIERLVTRRMAFWHDLYGLKAVTNNTKRRVKIPLDQLFTPDALRAMMQRRYDNIVASEGGVL